MGYTFFFKEGIILEIGNTIGTKRMVSPWFVCTGRREGLSEEKRRVGSCPGALFDGVKK